jgi:hypothetical protein
MYDKVSSEAFMVMIQVEVFGVVMLCNVVVRYQPFRCSCCLHLQGEVTGMGKNGIDIGPEWRGRADMLPIC